jgi:hypothetical protein
MYNDSIGGAGTSAGLFRADVSIQEVVTDVLRRRRSGGTFIRGPFAMAELCSAGKLPGKSLLVWLLVHHRVRMTHEPEVTLPHRLLASAGIDSRAKARALVALERAGLIQVRRERGKTARILLTKMAADH